MVAKVRQVGVRIVLDARRSTCPRKPCKVTWAVTRAGKTRVLGRGRRLGIKFSAPGRRLIRLRLTDRRGHVGRTTKVLRIKARPGSGGGGGPTTPAPAPAPPPPPTCEPGSTPAASAAAVRSSISSGTNTCVTSSIGDVSLKDVHPPRPVVLGTDGAGAMGQVILDGAQDITLRGRSTNVQIAKGTRLTLESCTLGGSAGARTDANLVYVSDRVTQLTIRNCDLGWTRTKDNSGNSGYGIRLVANEPQSDITISSNRIHNIGSDGIQVGGEPNNLVIDRNEISYIAVSTESETEHADFLQLVDYGNTTVTNNYFHHLGYRQAGDTPAKSYPSGGLYVHGGGTGPLLFQNNLITDARNRVDFGDLGTGGCTFNNTVVRRNTIVRGGTDVGGTELKWAVCGGSGDVLERNAIQDILDAHHGGTIRDNVTGSGVVLDGSGNCTSAACNPPSAEAIGYRKPSGVRW